MPAFRSAKIWCKQMPILYKLSANKATRKQRFFAHCIDTLLLLLIAIPMWITLLVYKTFIGYPFICISLLIVTISQSYFLIVNGQTIGKKIVKIKIVKSSTKINGGFIINILLRSIVGTILLGVAIPYPIYFFIDSLFIFREDRRCIHDLIAGTDVIDA